MTPHPRWCNGHSCATPCPKASLCREGCDNGARTLPWKKGKTESPPSRHRALPERMGSQGKTNRMTLSLTAPKPAADAWASEGNTAPLHLPIDAVVDGVAEGCALEQKLPTGLAPLLHPRHAPITRAVGNRGGVPACSPPARTMQTAICRKGHPSAPCAERSPHGCEGRDLTVFFSRQSRAALARHGPLIGAVKISRSVQSIRPGALA